MTGAFVAYLGMLLVAAVAICSDRDPLTVTESPEFAAAADQAIDLTGGQR